jgi:short-subunit dehydrogenase
MDVNFFGVLNGSKAFLPQMVENGEGALVNVSSIFGLIGTPNNADYCASKFAVRGFTEALMVEFHNSAIGIHLVHPGGIDTNIVRNERGAEFSKKYLTTPPEKIAKHVIKCIKRGQSKIVFGRSSFRVWLGANLVPKGILKRIVWRELKPLRATGEYEEFNPGSS